MARIERAPGRIAATALALALAGCGAIPQTSPPPPRSIPAPRTAPPRARPPVTPRARPYIPPKPALRPYAAPAWTPPRPGAAGPARVIGANARALEAMFGRAAQDMRGPTVRRLQFVGGSCVLDAYLYPPSGGGEPVVTWIDARLPGGDVVDKEWCVAALARR